MVGVVGLNIRNWVVQTLPKLVRRGWRRLLPGFVALLLTLGLVQIGVGESLENLVYNTLFQLRGTRPWNPEVVVIEIDESRSITSGEFLWSRDRLTDLMKILAEGDPSVVVIDLVLSESTPFDEALAAAFRQINRVVLAQSWDGKGFRLEPTPRLRVEAWDLGHTEQEASFDGLVRNIPLLRQGVPALSIVASRAHQNKPAAPLPPHWQKPLWINWAGPSAQAPHFSFLDVIDGRVPASAWRNKVVLVGLTTPTLDQLQTPYDRSPPAYGVYLQAAAIGNLLDDNGLYRTGWKVATLMLILGGPGLSLLMSRWRLDQRLVMWLILSLAVGLIGTALFFIGIWIPIAMPILLLSITSAVIALKEQTRINALLRQSEERYALVVQGSNGGLWDWNLKTNQVYFSQRWKELVGEDENTMGNQIQDWYERVHPDDLGPLQVAIDDYLAGKTEQFENEHRLHHRDDTYRWVLCRGVVVRDRTGQPSRMAGSQLDITARKAVEEQLWRSAYYDDLTELPNRAFFLDRLRQAIASASDNALYVYAVLLMDVDRFQVVNNSLGNTVGDQLLVAIGRRLRGFLSRESVVARRSGDEFIILMENIEHQSDVTHTAEQIQQILSLPFNLDGHEVYITVSIGIAISSHRHTNPEHLLQDADTAMYRAKAQGKAGYQVFDPAMHNRMVAKLKLENDLRRAISQEQRVTTDDNGEALPQELLLYYQPIVDLTTRKVVGFESLARWQHPSKGFLHPGHFITMAEETGLIVPLGWWILRQACRQMRRWHDMFPDLQPLTMSVNLASRQFSSPDLIQEVELILHDTNLHSSSLKLELTEGTIMDTGQSVINVLNRLRKLGIQLAIDDFGTGYSSLSYLARFPINTLKIDRSFVSKMGIVTDNKDNSEIVRTIVNLAHNLGMNVTAEGIETDDQRFRLTEMACEMGQGYYFDKPLPADAATQLLQREAHLLSAVSNLVSEAGAKPSGQASEQSYEEQDCPPIPFSAHPTPPHPAES